MKIPKIISPIFVEEELQLLKETNCRDIYFVFSSLTTKSSFESLIKQICNAKKSGFNVFVKFKNDVKESELNKIQEFIELLEKIKFDGVLVNDLGILEILNEVDSKINVFVDSGLNIHNLYAVDYLKKKSNSKKINICEEIYLNNLQKIKKYSDLDIAIDSNNLPWIAESLLEANVVDFVVLKGKFGDSRELINGINTVESLLNNPESFKNKKLPFKNIENSLYKSDHFTEEFNSARGRRFKFSGNIDRHKWKYKWFKTSIKKSADLIDVPVINLRLTSLEQLNELKKFIRKYRINVVKSVEFGEVLSTANLVKDSFSNIIEKVRQDCFDYNIGLKISTPKVLLERDLDRVYEYTKACFNSTIKPKSLVINNLGYWWGVVNDDSFNVPIEAGYGLNLKNSKAIAFLNKNSKFALVDFSDFKSIESIKQTIENIKDLVPARQITIAGNMRIKSSGLCPLNRNSAVLSRLSCPAPCHQGIFSISDKALKKTIPFAVDGFCRMHLYKDTVLDMYSHIPIFQAIGINEFLIDLSCLPAGMLPLLLKRFIFSLRNPTYDIDPYFYDSEYGMDRYLAKYIRK